jgi:hypothetical protein
MIQRQHAVRGDAGEQRPRPFGLEPPAREAGRRLHRRQPEADRRRVQRWKAGRSEDPVVEIRPTLRQRPNQAPVGVAILAKPRRRRRQRTIDQCRRRGAVERMRHHGCRLDPFQAMPLERQRPEEGGRDRHRVDRRADVMNEARKRQRLAAATAADCRVGLVEDDPPSGLRDRDRRSEPVRSRTDDDRVRGRHGCGGRKAATSSAEIDRGTGSVRAPPRVRRASRRRCASPAPRRRSSPPAILAAPRRSDCRS